MLIFKCRFTEREIGEFKAGLPAASYCLVNEPGGDIYYGVITDEQYDNMLDVLSGEALGCLEYLDEEELIEFIRIDNLETIGNSSLLESYRGSNF